ncbi:MAG: glycosyltransferase [Planctomycetaceae bacterium]
MPSLRILFAIGSLSGGGSERQLLGIMQRLDRSRFTPLLYMIEETGELLPELPSDVKRYAFNKRHAPPKLNWPGRLYRRQTRDLAAVLDAEKIDVIYDRTFPMTLVTAGATRHRPTARVSVAVSHPRHDFERTVHKFKAMKKRMLRRAYQEADLVLAVSEGVRQSLIAEFHVAPASVLALPNMLDLNRLNAATDQSDESFSTNRFHIVTAGRLAPEKGYDVLLDAVAEMVKQGTTDIRLHLFGQGPLEAELKNHAARLQIEPYVDFAGFQPNICGWLRRGDVFVLSSNYEGSPNALIEAAAMGVPVISTDCEFGPREILEEGRWGELVPVGDAKALAAGILRVKEKYDAMMARAREAKQAMLARYSPVTGQHAVEAALVRAHENWRNHLG